MKNTRFDDFVPRITGHVFRKCDPGWHIPPNTASEFNIIYVVKGSARYMINGESLKLKAGDLLCINKGDIISEAATYPHNLMHCYAVKFTEKYPTPGVTRDALFPPLNHIGVRQDVVDLFRELTIRWSEQQSGYIMKTQALMMMILARLAEIILYEVDSAPGDFRVNKIIRYISMHYSEKLTVKNLAQQVHLDSDYFGQLFKREKGMMVNQYIIRIRIQKAEDMLQSGNYKVHEVAENCGFSDTFHFYKSFKALRGVPPSRCIPKK